MTTTLGRNHGDVRKQGGRALGRGRQDRGLLLKQAASFCFCTETYHLLISFDNIMLLLIHQPFKNPVLPDQKGVENTKKS